MLGNKEIMAQNIKLQMAQNNVNATELCKALGIKQNTFSDWVNAKTYPRIDKIELMANYFGISKADLCATFSVKFTTHYDAVFTRFVAPVSPKYDTKV